MCKTVKSAVIYSRLLVVRSSFNVQGKAKLTVHNAWNTPCLIKAHQSSSSQWLFITTVSSPQISPWLYTWGGATSLYEHVAMLEVYMIWTKLLKSENAHAKAIRKPWISTRV